MCENPLAGVPEFQRPVVDISVSTTFWRMRSDVMHALKRAGLNHAAQAFRHLADECDDDVGMLFTMALLYIRVPGQEDV